MALESVIAFALLFAGLAVGATQIDDLQRAAEVGGQRPVASLGSSMVLFDQFDAASGNGTPDQDFEAALDAFDAQAGDDFAVPADAAWFVHEVRTIGSTQAAGGATVSVAIHHSANGGGNPHLPGAPVAGCSHSGIRPTVDAAGSFVVRLPEACLLTAGDYWLLRQTRQDVATHGQHFWSTRSLQTGSEAVWRNPGNGFGSGCTVFRPQTRCGVGGGASPDLLFQIVGEPAGSDLTVAIADAPDPVIAGQAVQYMIELRNLGPAPARDAELLLALAPAVAPQAATASHGGSCASTVDAVRCRWTGLVAAGAMRSATVDALTPAASAHGASVGVDGTVSAASNDPEAGNNAAAALTTVTTVADLQLALAASPDPVIAGQVWAIAADIANVGPSDARDVRVALSLPPEITLARADPGAGGTCSLGTQLECIWPATTNAGSGRQLLAEFRVAPASPVGSSLVSLAAVASRTTDADADNNTATARAFVQTSADLQISLRASPAAFAVGAGGELLARTLNLGPSDAQAVEVEIVMAADLRFAGVDPGGAQCLLPQVGLGGTIRCRWSEPTAALASRELRVLTSAGSRGQAGITAETRSPTADADPANNRVATVVAIGSEVREIPAIGGTGALVLCLLLVAWAVRRARP